MAEGRDVRGERVDKLAWGLGLIALGLLLTLDQWRVVELGGLSRLWPVMVVALGLGQLFAGKCRSDGVLWIGAGAIFLVVNYTDVGWRQIWPLFLVLGGLQVLLRGLSGEPSRRAARPDGKEARS